MALRPISAEKAMEQELLRHLASIPADETIAELGSNKLGLDQAQVELSRETYGSNEVARVSKKPFIIRLIKAFADPFILILIGISIVSLFTDVILVSKENRDPTTAIIILMMVLISGVMRFIQETKSGNAAEALANTIQTRCNLERLEQGRVQVPIAQCVVGDIVHLSAGDMVPADIRIISAKDLFISQSALTGESEPIEKQVNHSGDPSDALTDFTNLAFLGSTVISGTATAIVCATGSSTLFGTIAGVLESAPQKTSFDEGIESVSKLLIKLMLIMVPVVFLVNGLTKGDWLSALLFSLSIAVGLTPEMLPMIVTTCLAKGATDLSHKKVIVKKLDSIQNLGSIDILCTDKTGTLTEDRVVLERHLNIDGNVDERVLRYAFMNSYFETGLRNLIDTAILDRTEELSNEEFETTEKLDKEEIINSYHLIDELPFDFERRRVSVVVAHNKTKTSYMITKGAIEEVLACCTHVEINQKTQLLTPEMVELVNKRANSLAGEGMRVLGVCRKKNPLIDSELTGADECDMTLIGYLAFLDPPKQSSADAIAALLKHGVTTKVLTGDSPRVAQHVCKAIGLDVTGTLDGVQVESMSDLELAQAVEKTTIFAKLSPSQKSRVVESLRGLGHVVGFMGDGVNDAPAMKVSDCGISVDSATDVAKESADIILLEKDLMVLENGVIEGRKTYANMNKYIKITGSSNFGNIFSILTASAFLPFLPLEAVQLLFLNFINDLVCSTIPWDNVDADLIEHPRTWNAKSIASFMRWFGPTSSILDIITFTFLFFIICPMAVGTPWSGCVTEAQKYLFVATFQAGWFVESMFTQTFVVHFIRTSHKPFIESRASLLLTSFGLIAIVFTSILPNTSLGMFFGFSPLPLVFYIALAGVFILYATLASIVKVIYIKKFGMLL